MCPKHKDGKHRFDLPIKKVNYCQCGAKQPVYGAKQPEKGVRMSQREVLNRKKGNDTKLIVNALTDEIIDYLDLPKKMWKSIRFGVISQIGYHETKGILEDLRAWEKTRPIPEEDKKKTFWFWVNKLKGK